VGSTMVNLGPVMHMLHVLANLTGACTGAILGGAAGHPARRAIIRKWGRHD
jgi:hypothetical protein